MSVETALARQMVFKRLVNNREEVIPARKTSPFEYPECDGHPASSPYNWVLTDYIGYHFAKILGVTNEDIKQKSKS